MRTESVQNLVKQALIEDIGSGDITSALTIDHNHNSSFSIIAKQDFILCGVEFILQSFQQVNQDIEIKLHFKDGDYISKSDIILEGTGNSCAILSAERVALNFLQYLSAISTITNSYVKLVKEYGCEILDTRKTLPLYREAAKYAVLVGGGKNHRMGLYDQILIKDNHIIASGGIAKAIKKCTNSKLIIEAECETLAQVSEALSCPPDIIMLDNMDIDTMKKAINLINNRCKIEVSGNISLDNITKIAKLGVDYISVGKITHSVMAIDVSLEIL